MFFARALHLSTSPRGVRKKLVWDEYTRYQCLSAHFNTSYSGASFLTVMTEYNPYGRLYSRVQLQPNMSGLRVYMHNYTY